MASLDEEFDKAADLDAEFDKVADAAPAVADAGSPLDKALKSQTGDVVTVDTPTGPAKFTRSGQRFYDADEAKELFGKSMANTLDTGLKEASLSFLSGGGRLMDEMGGALKAAQSFPDWVRGRVGLGDTYRKGRDDIRAEVARSTARSSPQVSIPFTDAKVPALPVLGAMAPSLLAPLPATALGRIALATEQGGQSALEASEADLTRGQAADAALDTVKGAGLGLGTSLLGEGVTAGARGIANGAASRFGGIYQAQAAKDAQTVADEIASLRGKLGGESQKASRMFENTQRAAGGGVAPAGQSVIDPALQGRALLALSDPGTARLQEKVIERSLNELPSQVATVEGLERELAQRSASASADAAKRTSDYFAQPVFESEIAPRLGRFAYNAAVGTGTGAAGGAILGLGSLVSGVGDPLSVLGTSTALGLTQGLGKSAITMTRNAMNSPRVQAGALSVLQSNAATTAAGAQVAASVAGPAAAVAKENAYQALLQRFGINAKSPKELADEAFLRGQTDPSLQSE